MELKNTNTQSAKPARPKAVALLSGGLDSTLAISLLLDMGVEVEAVHFDSLFCNSASEGRREKCGSEARRMSETLGVKLSIFNLTDDFLEIVKNPKHGWGSSMNPCIDCRIYMLRKAKEYMERTGADFVVTGEVLGQRPMSQHLRAMRTIEQESGLDGLIVRPLCAKVMPPSKAEQEGLIDREKLLALKGRSRKAQMQLAADKGITDYAYPAGGCLLADKIFGRKLRELLSHRPDADLAEVRLLKYGRHFRLSDGSKIIVGRNEKENEKLEQLGSECMKLQVADRLGPVTLAPANIPEEMKLLAASITARYSQNKSHASLAIRCWMDGREELLEAPPLDEERLSAWRIE